MRDSKAGNGYFTQQGERAGVRERIRVEGRGRKIFRLLGKPMYVLFCKLHRTETAYAESHYLPFESTPFSLLQECLSDMKTFLFRMGRRVDKLPFPYMALFGSSEVDATGHLRPNTRTLGCMKDMQRYESQFPTATDFDWELFQIGWEAGAEWGAGTPCTSEKAGNTFNPPEKNSIAESQSTQEGIR